MGCNGANVEIGTCVTKQIQGSMTTAALLFAACLGSQIPGAQSPPQTAKPEAGRTLAPFFSPATTGPKAVDRDGFLKRWLLLEPIVKPSRTNTNLTSVYVRQTLNTEYFPNQFTVIPKDGDKVSVAGSSLAWHALDSSYFNVKLFRLAYGLNKPTYGVVFWAVTVVDSPSEMTNIRLSVGCNAASIWWLNGEAVLDAFTDRHMIVDDVVSKRLTLHKGRNILRCGLINGPGLSDFCVRFIDEDGRPIRALTTRLD